MYKTENKKQKLGLLRLIRYHYGRQMKQLLLRIFTKINQSYKCKKTIKTI